MYSMQVPKPPGIGSQMLPPEPAIATVAMASTEFWKSLTVDGALASSSAQARSKVATESVSQLTHGAAAPVSPCLPCGP